LDTRANEAPSGAVPVPLRADVDYAGNHYRLVGLITNSHPRFFFTRAVDEIIIWRQRSKLLKYAAQITPFIKPFLPLNAHLKYIAQLHKLPSVQIPLCLDFAEEELCYCERGLKRNIQVGYRQVHSLGL